MSLMYSFFNGLKTLFLLLTFALITGCIAEDDKDKNPTNSAGDTVNDTALALNGFWKGGFEQTDTLKVLIYNGDVYALDSDKGFFGTVESPSSEEVDFQITSYSFSYEDTANLEFVADGLGTVYTINGLLASTTLVVGDFETNTTLFGALTLTNDGSYSNNSSLSSLVGKWTTTDLELNITSRGRFHGVNNGANKNCSFEGQIELIDIDNSLLKISMNRRNCDDFNGDSEGFAAINTDGKLEIYSKMGSSLLFMAFAAPTTTEIPDTDEEEEAEEEVVDEV